MIQIIKVDNNPRGDYAAVLDVGEHKRFILQFHLLQFPRDDPANDSRFCGFIEDWKRNADMLKLPFGMDAAVRALFPHSII